MTLPTDLPAWQALARHQQDIAALHLRDLFARDEGRFRRFSLTLGDLLFDYSKHRITERTRALFCQLADEIELRDWILRLYSGDAVNATEKRAALHVALRKPAGAEAFVAGVNVMPDVLRVRARLRQISDAVSRGQWLGATGKPVTDVVNLGIGGSDLGPRLVARALRPYWQGAIRPHFVSNLDGADLTSTLSDLDPETTLFLVVSKTFSTEETLTNAHSARAWLVDALRDESGVARHFIAVSTNQRAATGFGIDPANVLEIWDWVGGRYSLWSAVGLAVACAVGMDHFEELLAGAHEVDEHFRTAPFAENIPALMGLLGVWYINFWGAHAHAVLPYDQSLEHLPYHLQQVDMESNGKSVDRAGRRIDGYHTSPVVFGQPGTNGQHAFYQLLHQGTRLVPADFIAAAESHHPLGTHHEKLFSHFLAQSEALMRGRSLSEVESELTRRGVLAAEILELAPHRVFDGNHPSSSILFQKLTPKTLGRLLALYEHKTFVQGVVWNVNSFDQWGVELGKELAAGILPELLGQETKGSHDASTAGLIEHYKRLRNE